MKKIIQIVLSLNFLFVGISFAQSGIKQVDFKNFTYQPVCGKAEPQSIKVVKGTFFEEKQISQVPDEKQKTPPAPVYERKYFSPYETIYGDLNSDGIDEAIVLTTCSNGGVESYSEGFIYGIKDGSAQLLTRIEGGDRALGGLRKVKIENGVVTVEKSRPGLTGDSCCAESAEITNYRLADGLLTQIGEKTSLEIYPPTRIQFPNEANQTSFDLKIPKRDKFKRFVITGKKGQTIAISTNSKDARLRLYNGNAELIINPKPIKKSAPYIATNVLTAKLKETGDFVFEVSNLSEGNIDLDVSVNVEIK